MNAGIEPEHPDTVPSVVLICHENDALDCEGIAAWLAWEFRLAGIVLLRDDRGSRLRKLRREYRRVGLLRLLDVILFRLFYQLGDARADARWVQHTVAELRARYPADISRVPRLLASNPNAEEVRVFIDALQPDIAVARCKYILRPEIFTLPRFGTYVLHPGICPLYRNAHGCFWALVNRDLEHVGMTLLKVDAGIDTGPVYLQASYAFDEKRESHIRIQHRVVLENLAAITAVFRAVCTRGATPMTLPHGASINWGQPWLTAYLRWQSSARKARRALT